MTGKRKLTKDSPAIQLFRRKFETGTITGKESPKTVWDSEKLFQQHKLHTFRVHYNTLRKEYQNTDDLRTTCSGDIDEPASKRARQEEDISEEDEDSIADEHLYDEKQTKDEQRLSFNPLHLISVWKEHDTMTKRVTVAIILPSGVDTGGFSLRVIEGGQHLELTVRWPRPLIDLQVMHKKWLSSATDNYQTYHPEYVGFQDSLKLYRARSTDWIEPSTKIALPFVVETHIHDKYNLAWRDSSTRMLYVRLKAIVEQYTVQNDNDSFDVL